MTALCWLCRVLPSFGVSLLGIRCPLRICTGSETPRAWVRLSWNSTAGRRILVWWDEGRSGAFNLEASEVISGTWGVGQMGQGEQFRTKRLIKERPAGMCFQLSQTVRWVQFGHLKVQVVLACPFTFIYSSNPNLTFSRLENLHFRLYGTFILLLAALTQLSSFLSPDPTALNSHVLQTWSMWTWHESSCECNWEPT